MDNQKTGSLIMISFDDLIMEFARYNDLHDFSILVASHEIVGSLKVRGVMSGVTSGITYQSKYDNIEFVDSLRPTAQAMEVCYAGNVERFTEAYNSHLLSSEPFMDLCCIVDMIVNEGCDVLIVMASYEFSGRIPHYLRDFILSEFDVQGYVYSELQRLSTNYDNKEMYEKIVKSLPFDVPGEFDGTDFKCIIRNIGDVDTIREKLELQKGIAATMAADPGEENDIQSIFFNHFTEDLEDKVRELLMKRTEDDIKDMCRSKRIRILPGSTKKILVDKIIRDIRLDSKRKIVEYERDND